ncbi:MAG: 2-C-methyl-D-erythritol 4-phosphate cytidylyltransferase [Candidatus Micrarchaeaceae archaeon]
MINRQRRASTAALIVAAGESRRMQDWEGKRIDKQFAEIAGKPLIGWTLKAFQESESVDSILLITSSANLGKAVKVVEELELTKVARILAGGRERRDSVAAGLCLALDYDIVIVHDGARPCVLPKDIERGIELVRDRGLEAAVAVSPVNDTIKEAARTESDMEPQYLFSRTIDRRKLVAASTPQTFKAKVLRSAYSRFWNSDATDDAGYVELSGISVYGYECSSWNGKVTRPYDLAIAEALLLRRKE